MANIKLQHLLNPETTDESEEINNHEVAQFIISVVIAPKYRVAELNSRPIYR